MEDKENALESWIQARKARSLRMWKLALEELNRDAAAKEELNRALLEAFNPLNRQKYPAAYFDHGRGGE